jgi:hypothetical protein
VRSVVVVLATEEVEGALLRALVSLRGARSLCLERPMKALLAAILLRLTGRDALGPDP